MRPTARLLAFLPCAILAASRLPAAEWPQFRGPERNGVIAERDVPVAWSETENVRWKVSIPGRGWSSPVIWGDKVFLTTAVLTTPGDTPDSRRQDRTTTTEKFRWEVYCLDRDTGAVRWKQVPHEGNPRISMEIGNTYASETPVTDGERLYVSFGMMGLYCYDLEGKLVWKNDLGALPMEADWGTGSSPVLDGDTLYVPFDNEEAPALIALEAKTGRERWRVKRDTGSSWSTPVIWANRVRRELVMHGIKTRSYDLKTGAVLWELNFGGGRCIVSPVPDGDRLFIGNERKGGGGVIYAIRAGATGDITPARGATTSPGVIWSSPNSGIEMSSPISYQGLVYVLSRRNGLVFCYHADTGESAYFRTPIGGAGEFWASPWAYDGKIFCLDAKGTTHVLAAGPELKRVGRNRLDDTFWASPAAASGMLILRGENHVYAIGIGKR